MWLDIYMQNNEVTSKIRKAQDVGQNRYRLTFTDGTTVNVPEAEVWMFYEVHGFPVEGVSR